MSAARVALALAIATTPGCQCGAPPDTRAPAAEAPALETPTSTSPTPEDPHATRVTVVAILVAWQGADGVPSSLARTEEDARARAEDLLAQLDVGADFGTLAATESDHAASRAQRGLVGTYARGEWPAPFEELAERLERLGPFETSEVLRTRGGWVIAQRWPVELRRSRHILIRFRGAAGAGPEIARSHEDALTSALELERQLGEGADFAALARTHSDDRATAGSGGELGTLGRGRLSPAYESILYQLAIGEVSEPIETDEGFELIEREPVPDP